MASERFKDEKQFQSWVMNLAKVYKWRAYHTHRSNHSAAGYLDTTLVRDGFLIYLELKMPGNKLTSNQEAWMKDLREVSAMCHGMPPAVQAYCVYPEHTMWIEILLNHGYPQDPPVAAPGDWATVPLQYPPRTT